VFTQCFADHGPDGQVGYVVVVHDIEVDNVGAGGQYVIDFLAQISTMARTAVFSVKACKRLQESAKAAGPQSC